MLLAAAVFLIQVDVASPSVAVNLDKTDRELKRLEAAILEICPNALASSGKWMDNEENLKNYGFNLQKFPPPFDGDGSRIASFGKYQNPGNLNVRFSFRDQQSTAQCVVDSLYWNEEGFNPSYVESLTNLMVNNISSDFHIEELKKEKEMTFLFNNINLSRSYTLVVNYHSFKDLKDAIWFYVLPNYAGDLKK